MAALSMLMDSITDQGTFTGLGAGWVETGGFSVRNLVTDDVQAMARNTAVGPLPFAFTIDLGRPRAIGEVAFVNHNASKTAFFSLVISNSPDFATQVYESVGNKFWQQTELWGSRPFGEFPFDGIDLEAFPTMPIAFLNLGQLYVGRYIKVTVFENDTTAGGWQCGRFLAGVPFTPPINMSAGSSVTVVDPSSRSRTRGGRRIVSRRPRYRQFKIVLANQSKAAAMTTYHDFMVRRGVAGDMLVIWDPDDAAPVRNRLTLYCALTDTAEMAANENGTWGLTLQVEELV
ncbi:hypothetical protein FBZ89_104383 [Nitrospirillum amazonense]|uniref:Uncharacterized protein n=1 Tax=Nitrospirillum amazonense TaxID=28077 RepID=A0A560FKJ7_9PROT|nr:hypothetical protein [Nitrospirillum amazonense]TWB22133.1 hypothetical protein FBZ89_104383 [Nitrospirillum amazonense]